MTRTLRWLLIGLACVLVPALVWSQSSSPTNAVLQAFLANVQARGFNYAVEQLAYTVGTLPGSPDSVTSVTNFTGVDRTGATDSTAGVQAALTAACKSPVRSLYFPPGTYKFLSDVILNSGQCDNLVIYAAPNTATLIADALNVSSPRILRVINQSFLVIDGLTFDGNVAANPTGTTSLVAITGPSDHVLMQNNVFQNTSNSGLLLSQVGGINATTSAQSNEGSSTLTFASVPAGVKAGAYFFGSEIDPDIYVTAVGATTVTTNKALTDTILNATGLHFTFAFNVSTDAPANATQFLTASTTNLAVGQTIWSGDSFCITPKTHITAIVANTSVTFDQAITCKVAANTNVASIGGLQDFIAQNNVFENIGQSQRTLGSLNVVTNGSTSLGATQVTFTCVSASCNPGVGLIPGDMTSTTGLPTGMPASNLVIDGPTVNSGAGTYTVTFASPTTAIIPTSTTIPMKVGAISGNGFAVQLAFGAWFSNVDLQFLNNTFRHAWSSPLAISNTWNLLLQGNIYLEDWLEYQNPTVAPSACIAVSFGIKTRVVGEKCSGATGNGAELNHNIGFWMSAIDFSNNGRAGVYFCGGHDYYVAGRVADNGQWLNHPEIQAYSDSNFGVGMDGSCTGSQGGTLSHVVIDSIIAGDDQVTPTQTWAVNRARATGTLSDITIGNVSAVGNTSGVIGLIPALTGCGGGSPALATGSTDYQGVVTEGTTATGCVITWNAPKAVAPICQLTSPNGAAFTSFTTSTTALTIVNGSASGNVYTYRCSP